MQKLGEKLNNLIRKNGITQNELAEKTGLSRQIINSICHGRIKNSKALFPIAKYFGVDYTWLVNDAFKDQITSNQLKDDILILDKFKKIPFLTTRVLTKEMIVDNKLLLENVTKDYELVNDADHRYLFTLSSTNNSLKFRFGNDCTLIFHTNLEPISGDFIIAYLPDKELFVYRDLEIKKGKKILLPVDEDIYKPIILKDNDLIVAVLYEKRIKRSSVKQEGIS